MLRYHSLHRQDLRQLQRRMPNRRAVCHQYMCQRELQRTFGKLLIQRWFDYLGNFGCKLAGEFSGREWGFDDLGQQRDDGDGECDQRGRDYCFGSKGDDDELWQLASGYGR